MSAVVRRTGLSAHVLRAWERRYGAVRPERTPGGARRYSERDVARLHLLRAGVEAGEAIGQIARLSDVELGRLRAPLPPSPPAAPLAQALAAVERLDLAGLERLLGAAFAALGPRIFATEIAIPLLRQVGERWERGELSIAGEHLLTSVSQRLLGAGLGAGPGPAGGPTILFATPSGERHELGALVAAIWARSAGADAVFLGPDLPGAALAEAADALGPAAVALGAVALGAAALRRYVVDLRSRLPEATELWVGGPQRGPAGMAGVREIADLDDLASQVARLARRRG